MESSENPYQGPTAEDQNAPRDPEAVPSSIPKVFGIIHLVYAALGGLGSGAFANMVLDPIKEQGQDSGQNFGPVIEAFDDLMTASLIQSAISFILAILLLVAGIQLLKYRAAGRKLSNLWAVTRIVTAIPLTFLAIRAQTNLQEALQTLSQSDEFTEMAALMGSSSLMGIIGFLVVCLYPVVSLILVNQEKTKEALK